MALMVGLPDVSSSDESNNELTWLSGTEGKGDFLKILVYRFSTTLISTFLVKFPRAEIESKERRAKQAANNFVRVLKTHFFFFFWDF